MRQKAQEQIIMTVLMLISMVIKTQHVLNNSRKKSANDSSHVVLVQAV